MEGSDTHFLFFGEGAWNRWKDVKSLTIDNSNRNTYEALIK